MQAINLFQIFLRPGNGRAFSLAQSGGIKIMSSVDGQAAIRRQAALRVTVLSHR